MENPLRYEGNKGALTAADMDKLRQSRVFVVGCGALGGFVLEALARLGIGHITAADGDVFEVQNLNRQLLATQVTLGKNKAQEAARRLAEVNPETDFTAVPAYVLTETAHTLLEGNDVVLDCAGELCERRMLIAVCANLGIPLITAAISGWDAQVTVILPNSGTYDRICPPEVEETPVNGSPAFSPMAAAALQVAETVKLLCGKGKSLTDCVLSVDFLRQEYRTIQLL
ncbi:MAG: HesA/MoeB/ThiF family protein [Oscillospiraceae bacterium]|jgi:molybdopterin/thiamine biosynthesis adenylyltransferase|nr:HesA/MoeB/ThiF family protein [Oscillospiraceae bacterium]